MSESKSRDGRWLFVGLIMAYGCENTREVNLEETDNGSA